MKVKNMLSALLVPVIAACSVQMSFAAGGSGTGTAEDPYLISSVEDWNEFGEYVMSDGDNGAGEHWKLTADIDFSGYDGGWIAPVGKYDVGDGTNELPEGTSFKGHLDGGGHVVKNYTINALQNELGNHGAFGLFSAIGGDAVIENLGAENVTLRMGANWIYISAGAVAGTMIGNAKITNCYSKNVICDNANPDGQYITSGGLAGSMYDSASVINSYGRLFTPGTNVMYYGGIVGGIYSANTSIQKCYSDTTIGVADAGAWGGGWWEMYYPDTTTLPWPYAYYSQETPVGYIGETQTAEKLKNVPNELKAVFEADSNNINGGYPIFPWQRQQNVLNGSGTESDPYLIEDTYDFYTFAETVDTDNKYFKLTSDIDLNNAVWKPIGSAENPFKGDFDGNGHVIKNYRLNLTVDYTTYGLFAYAGGNSCIHNLGIENVTAMLYQWHWNEMFGGLVGEMNDNASVRECYVKNVSYELQWDPWPLFNEHPEGQGQFHTAGGLIGILNGDGVEVARCYALGVEEDHKDGTGDYAGLSYEYIMYDSGLIGRGEVFRSVSDCYSDTYVVQNKLGTKVFNSYQTMNNSEWYDGYTWGAYLSDVRYIAWNWSSAYVPGELSASGYDCFPSLKWENSGGKYLNYVKEGRMSKENIDEIFAADGATCEPIWEEDMVSLVMNLPQGSHIAYDVNLTADKYYKVSFKSRTLHAGTESELVFRLGDEDLTELLQNKTIGDKWETTAVYVKPSESRPVMLGIAGSVDMLIDDVEVVEVDADIEQTMLDNSVYIYNKLDELNSDLYTQKKICGGVEVQYYSEYIAPDGKLQNLPIGLGSVEDTLNAVMKIADRQVTRTIPVTIKETEPIDILNVGMVDAEGGTVYSIENASRIDKVYANINDAGAEAKLYVALYTDSALTGIRICDLAEEMNVGLDVNGADTVKLFVFDGTLKPYSVPEQNLPTLSDDSHVTIHTIGDSLCATYAESDMLRGWGQLIGKRFDSNNVTVDNSLARSGMTAEEFIYGGRFDQLLAKLQPGDYVFIQLATNDFTRFTKDEFKNLLMQFVLGSREKGAIPVFVTSPEKLTCATDNLGEDGRYETVETLNGYPEVMREIGRERNVPVIDLNAATAELMSELGRTGTEALGYYVEDTVHFTEAGAEYLCDVISNGAAELKLPVARFLIND